MPKINNNIPKVNQTLQGGVKSPLSKSDICIINPLPKTIIGFRQGIVCFYTDII